MRVFSLAQKEGGREGEDEDGYGFLAMLVETAFSSSLFVGTLSAILEGGELNAMYRSLSAAVSSCERGLSPGMG